MITVAFEARITAGVVLATVSTCYAIAQRLAEREEKKLSKEGNLQVIFEGQVFKKVK